MSEQASAQGDKKSGSKRSKLLIAILAILLAALGYDYVVARPSVDSAYDKIAERSVAVNADTTQMFTDSDVRELLGREPARTFNDADGDRVEVYSWRAGLPFRTHDLFVVYKSNDGRQMFYRHAKFAYETSVDVSPNSVVRVVEVGDLEDITDIEYERAMGGGEPSEDSGQADENDAEDGSREGGDGGNRPEIEQGEPASETAATEKSKGEEPKKEESTTQQPTTQDPNPEDADSESPPE